MPVTIYTSMDTSVIAGEVSKLDGVSEVEVNGLTIMLDVERPTNYEILDDFCQEVKEVDKRHEDQTGRSVVKFVSPGQPRPTIPASGR